MPQRAYCIDSATGCLFPDRRKPGCQGPWRLRPEEVTARTRMLTAAKPRAQWLWPPGGRDPVHRRHGQHRGESEVCPLLEGRHDLLAEARTPGPRAPQPFGTLSDFAQTVARARPVPELPPVAGQLQVRRGGRYPITCQRQDKEAPMRVHPARSQIVETFLDVSIGGTLRRHLGRRVVGKRRQGLRAVSCGPHMAAQIESGGEQNLVLMVVNSQDECSAWAIARPPAWSGVCFLSRSVASAGHLPGSAIHRRQTTMRPSCRRMVR